MDDLNRCWLILGLEPGSSEETVKWAYRNLVKAWHPDQFGHDPIQQHEAQERLKEVNWAYAYLEVHVFPEPQTTENTEATSPTKEPEPQPREPKKAAPDRKPPTAEPATAERGGFWQMAMLFVVILVGGTLIYYVWPSQKGYERSGPRNMAGDASQPRPGKFSRASDPALTPPPAVVPENPRNILSKLVPANGATVTIAADGTHLKAPGPRDYLRTAQPLRPPFTLRAQVWTDSGDVRLYYALGIVVFNWTAKPDELRVHDPLTGLSTGAPGQGFISLSAWHELVWEVTSNSMIVAVDGEIRFEGKGDYGRLNAYPAIGSRDGPLTIRSLEIEGQPTTNAELLALKPAPPFPGSLLASMTPANDVRVANEPEGLTLTGGSAPGPMLKGTEPLRPPFVLRVRAKTDSVNIRLYYALGTVIFNWEDNPGELRVHDPLNNQITAVPGMGRIQANEWHYLVWEVSATGMKISVDGQLRFQNRKNYSKAEGFPGIGPHLGKLTVDSFVVEQK